MLPYLSRLSTWIWPKAFRRSFRQSHSLRRAVFIRYCMLLVASITLWLVALDYVNDWQADLLADYRASRTNPMTLLALGLCVLATSQQRPFKYRRPTETFAWLAALAVAASHPLSGDLARWIAGADAHLGTFGWNSALVVATLAVSQLVRRWSRTLGLSLLAASGFVSMVALNGYLLGAKQFFGEMALTTLFCLLALVGANALRFARHPLINGLFRDTQSGQLVRMQALASVLVILFEPLLLRPELTELRASYPLLHTIELLMVVGLGLYFASRFLRLLDRERLVRQRIRQSLSRDALTGAGRRDMAADYFLRWDMRQPLGLILLDLDHFKSINDTHGHRIGDDVLRQVSACLRRELRVTDVLVRWGGEEFLVLARLKDGDALADLAERLRLAMRSVNLPQLPEGVTASFGTCLVESASGCDLAACVARADAALYRAKEAGRNRVEHARADGGTWAGETKKSARAA